jgi:5'-phosphate synthase pdxT subunit
MGRGKIKTSGEGRVKIGILAVQGDYEAHAAMLEKLGVASVLVRLPGDLEGCAGLILPGGESTTQLQFLREEGLLERIREFAAAGGAIFGTCAGAILLAREVKNPRQDSLGLLDATVLRNGYGRQMWSAVVRGRCVWKSEPLEMVFIRGPVFERIGPGVEALAEYEGKPVLVRQGRILAASFHPELTADTSVHERFLQLAGMPAGAETAAAQRP